jgi:hypothetical protein
MGLVRKQIYITANQDRAVKHIARRRGVTEAEVVGEALDSWLTAERSHDSDPFAGMVNMTAGPAAVDHGDIYGRDSPSFC